jgi:hypothetical protein
MLTKQAFFKQKDFFSTKAMGTAHFGGKVAIEKLAKPEEEKAVSGAVQDLAGFIIFRRTAIVKNTVFQDLCCSYLNIWDLFKIKF